MGYTYTPTYYTSLQDSITSICKNILPFSFKKRRLPAIAAAEQRLSKQQSDNLKWQQESFHQMLHLMGLCKEGIVQENEVSAFRTHLLESILTAPADHEPAPILRDKLIFLQELFYAKCISEEEYHSSKRPLLQRLAVQGAVIGARDVIVGAHKEVSNEEWSVIDLKEEPGRSLKSEALVPTNRLNEASTMKKMKGSSSVFSFISNKNGDLMEDRAVASDVGNASIKPRGENGGFSRNELICSTENPFWNANLNDKENESNSILMMVSLPEVPAETQSGGENGKRKAFRGLFRREQKDGSVGGRGNENDPALVDKGKLVKKAWGFDGFMKWKKSDSEDETAPLSLSEKSDYENCNGGKVVAGLIGEGQDAKQIKKKLNSNGALADLSAGKDLGRNMREELSRIQTELRAKHAQVHLSDDRVKEISTQLPVNNDDLKKFFPKSWCDQHGNAVLEVVRQEFKDHTEEMGSYHQAAVEEKHSSKRWTTFADEENSHPNLSTPSLDYHQLSSSSYTTKQARLSSSKSMRASFNNRSSVDKGFKYNPFFDM